MAVNETVIALLRPKPDLSRMATDPPEVRAAAQAVVDTPPGIGTIGSYWTEVPLPRGSDPDREDAPVRF
ncbi:hypothetical protein [Streptomyces anulatus]|uniref:hypothetical protein n=1 Tax=Streptomyces anulatus TaxID=1892 RepID=UPI00343B940A